MDACDKILQEFEDAFATLDKALKAPRKALDMLDKVASKLTDLASFDLGASTPDIPSSFNNPADVMAELLNCAAIQNSPLGTELEKALDAIDAGEAIPSSTQDSINSQANSQLSSATDEALSKTPIGKVGNLRDMYTSAVNKANSSEAFNTLEVLRDCIEAACGTADQATSKLEELKEKSRTSSVDNTPEDPILSSDKVTEEIKSTYNEKSTEIESLKADISNFKVL